MPKYGDVLYVKTTEEPVLVVGTRTVGDSEVDYPKLIDPDAEVVVVRRPIGSQENGIQYKFFDFLATELETYEEQAKRRYVRLMDNHKIAMAEENMVSGAFDKLSTKPS